MDEQGHWDILGGRLEHGESWEEALKREIQEEIGVEGEILDEKPLYFWIAQDEQAYWRFVLCFRVKLKSFDFRKSNENNGHEWFNKETIQSVTMCEHTKKIKELL